MLPLQFFGQNLHFAISLFTAFVFFAVFWLYFDAWTAGKKRKELIKAFGFLLVCLSFLVEATNIEQSVLGNSFFGDNTGFISTVLCLAGFIGIIFASLSDPLQAEPDVEEPDQRPVAKTGAFAATNSFGLVFALPVGALAIAQLYWRRATKGKENHLKPVALGFLLLGGYELLALTSQLRGSSNPRIASLTEAFGLLWLVMELLLLASALVLIVWVWKYLIKRLMSQLFMIFVGLTILIFLLTTLSFTYLMMHSVQNDALNNLQTAANVLNYGFDAKKATTVANAQSVGQDSAIVAAVVSKDHKSLQSLTGNFLSDNKQSSLIITDTNGEVLLRAEDPSRWGDSLSSDTSVRRALAGENSSTIAAQDSVLAPLIYIKSTTPVRSGGTVVGSVTAGLLVDNGFTDGVKKATGLDSAVYSGNVRSATSFIAPDGKSRWIGIKENSALVKSTVLSKGQTFKGQLDVLNRPYLAVYTPLKDADNTVVGMLFIGEPQDKILQTAGHSIELTFLVAAVLIFIMIIPAYWLSRYLSSQLE